MQADLLFGSSQREGRSFLSLARRESRSSQREGRSFLGLSGVEGQ